MRYDATARPEDVAAFLSLPPERLEAAMAAAEDARAGLLAWTLAEMAARGDAAAILTYRWPPGVVEHVLLFRYDPGTA